MISEDILRQSLQERDRQIADLRTSLQARDKRIRELELALLKSLDNSAAPAEEPSAPPLKGRDEQAKQLPRLFSLLRLDSSSGVCDDSWLEAKSVLALRDSVAGHYLQLDFYLPDHPTATAKPLTLASNFGESLRLTLQRAEVTPCLIRVPASAKSQPFLELETPAEPRNGSDLRQLGVVILDARVAE